MAKFSYSMSDADAILAFKKACQGQGIGAIAILSENGNRLKVGAPMMTVSVVFENGTCTTKGGLIGKSLESSVNTKLELIDGFKKIG